MMNEDTAHTAEMQLRNRRVERVVGAMFAGAIAPGEMFRQLDSLIETGFEKECFTSLSENCRDQLQAIVIDRKLSRGSYDGKYRTVFGLFDSSIIENSDVA